MFESNTDFEFDEIFGDSFESDKPKTPKRTFASKTSSDDSNKKPCIYRATSSIPSTLFAKAIDKNPNVTFSLGTKPPSASAFLPKASFPFTPTRRDSRKVVLRKFPGPAGLLPDRKDCNVETSPEVNSKESKQPDMDICSQFSVRAFREGPWEQMCKDFSSAAGNTVEFLPNKYNIAWIKAKMKNNKLINQKGPFLAAIVQRIKRLDSKSSIIAVLKDATGQIHATIIQSLYEEYANVLKEGSVVILKQFGVIKSDHGSDHYLTITANSLVSVYSAENTYEGQDKHLNQVNVTTIQRLSVEDFLKNISEVKSRHKAALLEQKLDFGSVYLNLRPLSAGNLSSCRPDFARMQTNENRTPQRDQFVTSSCGKLNAKETKYNNNFTKNTSFSRVGSGSPENFNKENNVGVSDMHRFHFKTRWSSLNKQNDASVPSVACLENKLDPAAAGLQTQLSHNLNTKTSTNRVASQSKSNNTNCSQISVSTNNLEHSAILEEVFEGVDADLLFEDF